MIAAGLRFEISESGVSNVINSENMPNSRHRRAISWVYWDPKSRMTTPFSIIEFASLQPIVRRFFRNTHIMHMRFSQPLGRNADEFSALLQIIDISGADIAHS